MSDDGFEIDLQEARTAAEHDFPDLASHLHDQARTLMTVETVGYGAPPEFWLGDYMGVTPMEYQADVSTLDGLRSIFGECLGNLTTYLSHASSVVDETGLALRKIVDLYARADGQG